MILRWYWLDTRWACGGVGVDEDGVVRETAPIFRRFLWSGPRPSDREGPVQVRGDMRVQQVKLSRDNTRQVVWVDVSWRLRPGMEVIGKDDERWTVEVVYSITKEVTELSRGWRVGGL